MKVAMEIATTWIDADPWTIANAVTAMGHKEPFSILVGNIPEGKAALGKLFVETEFSTEDVASLSNAANNLPNLPKMVSEGLTAMLNGGAALIEPKEEPAEGDADKTPAKDPDPPKKRTRRASSTRKVSGKEKVTTEETPPVEADKVPGPKAPAIATKATAAAPNFTCKVDYKKVVDTNIMLKNTVMPFIADARKTFAAIHDVVDIATSIKDVIDHTEDRLLSLEELLKVSIQTSEDAKQATLNLASLIAVMQASFRPKGD